MQFLSSLSEVVLAFSACVERKNCISGRTFLQLMRMKVCAHHSTNSQQSPSSSLPSQLWCSTKRRCRTKMPVEAAFPFYLYQKCALHLYHFKNYVLNVFWKMEVLKHVTGTVYSSSLHSQVWSSTKRCCCTKILVPCTQGVSCRFYSVKQLCFTGSFGL